MKGLIKVCSSDSAMWIGLRMIGLVKEYVNVGECAVSCSVGRPWKRWIDTMKVCLRKRSLDVKQARRMVNGGSL